MEREIQDATFRASYHYKETDETGRPGKTIETEREVSMRGFKQQKHRFVRMAVSGRELTEPEMRGELLEWRVQELMLKKTRMPFMPALRGSYRYALLGEENWEGTPVWRLGFEPNRRGEGYLQGAALVRREDGNVVRLEFRPASVPFMVSAMGIVLDYAETGSYWLPFRFQMSVDVRLDLLVAVIRRHISVDEEYSDYRFNRGLGDGFFELEQRP